MPLNASTQLAMHCLQSLKRYSATKIMNYINRLIKIYNRKKTHEINQGTVTGFELATSMTMDKRSIHYATSSPCDWFAHKIFYM